MASSRRPFRDHRSMSLPPNTAKFAAPEAQLWGSGLLCAYERVDKFHGCYALGEGGPSWKWTRIGWPRVVELLQADMALVDEMNELTRSSSTAQDNRPPSDITSTSSTSFSPSTSSFASLAESVTDRRNSATDASSTCPKIKHSNFEPPSFPHVLTSPDPSFHPSTHGPAPFGLHNNPHIPNPNPSGVGDRDRAVFWIHLDAAHPDVIAALARSRSMTPAVSAALRDESRLISDRMRFLLYEVPVAVGGGLLFELLGQSAGSADLREADVPVVLRSWLERVGSGGGEGGLVTALHIKGEVRQLAVLGVDEVQDVLDGGGDDGPATSHELTALLTSRLARWDDRLFRKNVFGRADEAELKFVNRRRGTEELPLLSIIINEEVRRLATEVIRVKWSLHAREEILFQLGESLRGEATRNFLATTRSSTREMLREQESVRDRLFNLQDVTQGTIRAGISDKSLRVQTNLAVMGGGGLVLSIVTGLFGVNLDGIPGSVGTGHMASFTIFATCLLAVGALVLGVGFAVVGSMKEPTEKEVSVRYKEFESLVQNFQKAAEGHHQIVRRFEGRWRQKEHPPVKSARLSVLEDLAENHPLLG